nr:transposase [Azospirillum lipoferum]
MSDEQYRLIEPPIPPPKPAGRPRSTGMRHLLDGLFYVVRTGCQWRGARHGSMRHPAAVQPYSAFSQSGRAGAGAACRAVRSGLPDRGREAASRP